MFVAIVIAVSFLPVVDLCRIQTAVGAVIEPMKLTDEVEQFIDKTEMAKQSAQEVAPKKDPQEAVSQDRNKKERRTSLRNAKKKLRIKAVRQKKARKLK